MIITPTILIFLFIFSYMSPTQTSLHTGDGLQIKANQLQPTKVGKQEVEGSSKTYAQKWHSMDAMMGVQDKCDDAKSHLDVDWPGFSSDQYTCPDTDLWTSTQSKSKVVCHKDDGKNDPRWHKCMTETIEYDEIPPVSGNHRPNWPKYGEYKYVPPQRWIHNLEHGAVVLLYHPCTRPEDVKELRSVLVNCLRRHIITPYNKLSRDKPFAMVTWGCKMLMSYPDTRAATQFILDHALHGGEDLAKEGQYTLEQTKLAEVVEGSDYKDSVLCPKTKTDARDTDMQNSADLM